MAVYKQPKSKYWWYKFTWNGEQIRESTKQTNKRTAEQMEAAHRTALAKGEVGIRERKSAPTLKEFAERDFLPFVRSTMTGKPRTVVFYETTAANLAADPKLACLPLDTITSEHIAGYVAKRRTTPGRRGAELEISTLNRDLATLRRMFRLAQEWGKVSTVLPRVKMLPGENQRERVLTPEEEQRYLAAAPPLLREVATILVDCALRPEECFRLRPENVRDRAIWIYRGKRDASRRRIPASDRAAAILDMRTTAGGGGWLFPAETKSGHIETSSLKKQHAKALKTSGVAPFELYTLRHTCLTRWAKTMDPYTLHVVAGHADMKTTLRYVHPSDADVREAIAKARGGHTSGHTAESADLEGVAKLAVVN
jgi:integrase